MSTPTIAPRIVSEQRKLIKRIQAHLKRYEKELPRSRKTQEIYISEVFAPELKMWKVTAQQGCAGFGVKVEN